MVHAVKVMFCFHAVTLLGRICPSIYGPAVKEEEKRQCLICRASGAHPAPKTKKYLPQKAPVQRQAVRNQTHCP
jgi:hypothetical protein